MKIEARTLICVASWEDRFLLGFERLLEYAQFSHALVFYSDEYSEWTVTPRSKAQAACNEKGVIFETGVLYASDSARTWTETLANSVGQLPEGSTAVVDLSTMPREIIWETFWFLQYRKCHVKYVYNRPESYGEWLSRDPDRPRLVYKMSGISRISARTALLVLAGYDVDRVRHLVDTFEPAVTLLGLQKDSVDPENAAMMRAQSSAFAQNKSVVQFWLDAYSYDHGMQVISYELSVYANTYNVIMASMGPKLSAVSLYQLHRLNDSFGLVYLPSREFNCNYSHGIGEQIWGTLTME